MSAWLIALIGVGGTISGAVLAIWGNRLSAGREDARKREERIWADKRAVYLPTMSWIGATDERLQDIRYSYNAYLNGEFVNDTNQWPIPEAVKQIEYRHVLAPDSWNIPEGPGEVIMTQLRALARRTSCPSRTKRSSFQCAWSMKPGRRVPKQSRIGNETLKR